MEANKIFVHRGFPIILVINVLSTIGAKSEVYRVGDDELWNSDVNYGSWSQKYDFRVGDVLVFKYSKTEHNVYQVTETTYQSCNSSTGVLAKYESGEDEVRLTSAKKYRFICNVAGHCLSGMRLIVDVKEASISPSMPQPEPSPPANSCRSYHALIRKWSFPISVVASGFLLKLHI